MMEVIRGFYPEGNPEDWIKKFGDPQPQDYYGSLVVEVTTENPTRRETLSAKNDLPWHHDKGYLTDVHSHVAIYCVEAKNAGAIQFL